MNLLSYPVIRFYPLNRDLLLSKKNAHGTLSVGAGGENYTGCVNCPKTWAGLNVFFSVTFLTLPAGA